MDRECFGELTADRGNRTPKLSIMFFVWFVIERAA